MPGNPARNDRRDDLGQREMFGAEGREWRRVENRSEENQLVESSRLLPIAAKKIATRPTRTPTEKTRYDQITVLGIATKAKTAAEFITLPLTTIPFRPGCAPQREILSVECIQISQRKERGKTATCPARCSSHIKGSAYPSLRS